MRLGITREDGRDRDFWIPLILIWPLIVVLMIALAPVVIVLVILFGRPGKRRKAIMSGPVLLFLFCAARGLSFEAGDRNEHVHFMLI